jgi:hypothetical protein
MKLNIKTKTEIVKNIVETIAFVLAGGWALYTFVLKDRPILEHRTKVESDIVWNGAVNPDTCEGEFKVNFENMGTTAFDISRVRVRGWEFAAVPLDDIELAKYMDVNTIARETPFFERTYEVKEGDDSTNWTPFLGHYPPGTVWKQSFQFAMKRIPNKWALFMVEFYEKGKEDKAIDATYSWDALCRTDVEQKANVKSRAR